VSDSYRRLFRREVVDICIFIFIADVVTGVQTPLFPLYTTNLGASLATLGLITAVLGLTRLASSVPVGMLSDRLDRKTVLVGGMVTFAMSFALYAVAPNPGWLVLPRVLQAIGMVATFPLGIAYIGDLVEPRDRGAAIGVYTAAMGSGFAVGPLIGSWVGSVSGIPAAYACGAVIAVLGAVFGVLRLVRKRPKPADGSPARKLFDLPSLAALVRQPAMLTACVANAAMTVSMTGAIFTYFPVYARGVGISTVAIGSIFAWRSFASASGRIPMGPLAARLPAHWTIVGVLLLEAGIDIAISRTASAGVLTAILILEGIGVGVFFVSAQSAVAEAAAGHNRGAAVGLYWMAGSLGDLFGPIGLGVVAQTMGLVAVFQVVAGVVVIGAVIVGVLGVMATYRSSRAGRVSDLTAQRASHQ